MLMANLPEPIRDRRRAERRRFDSTAGGLKLLERSTYYRRLINELADIFDVTITSTQRSRAFQVVMEFVEELEARNQNENSTTN